MQRERVVQSAIVRVVERPEGVRIQVFAFGSRAVREFDSWAAALAFVRSVTERSGLR
jgi:hypothetical protein